jgi:hypothetical protein
MAMKLIYDEPFRKNPFPLPFAVSHRERITWTRTEEGICYELNGLAGFLAGMGSYFEPTLTSQDVRTQDSQTRPTLD